MKTKLPSLLVALVLALAFDVHATVRFVDLNSPNPTPPFLDWTTAATNIQDAIDASVDGDQILVTNGVYQTGGKVMAGDLTNRVALDKAVTVQSVNGPWTTMLRGAGAVNGNTAVRCAWLTNGASLMGFALQGGATRLSGDNTSLRSGGGVWCASSNALVANCLIISNTASAQGGGAFQGTIRNSLVLGNVGLSTGAGAYGANLNNCTVLSNSTYAVYLSRLTNCIAYYNDAGANCFNCLMSYCCTIPVTTGTGSFATPPQLFVDGIHLTATSPCIGTGTNFVFGTDILGKPWGNPPSVGCAEWQPGPLVTQPQIQLAGAPVGFTLRVTVGSSLAYSCWWLQNGTPLQDDSHFSSTQTTNLVATGVSCADSGSYQLVVSNTLGVVTSSVAPLVIHCVDAGNSTPTPPYTTWATAASTIQDAITAAAPNEAVLVTNGVYATGGKSMDGVLTNRVCVDKPILVASVNGPYVTTIQGTWDPVFTNGTGAVRCAWLTNGAALAGFTVQGGATRVTIGNPASGGGVWCASANALVANCRIVANAAYYYGGGVYQGTLRNSLLLGNSSGTAGSGAYGASLNNCTVVSNYCWRASSVYGADSCKLTNCIVYYNAAGYNYYGSTLSYCCATPAYSGGGNFTAAPQLFPDGVHLIGTSPCLGAGTNLALGTDVFGRAWATPPSVGCAEWQPEPLVAQPQIQASGAPVGIVANAVIAGPPPFTCWWLKNGVPLQDDGHFRSTQTTNLLLTGISCSDVGNYQLVVSNAFGVVTSSVAPLVVHCVNAGSANPVLPYTTWSTAATNIQDAITAAAPGEVVLVTNGFYATGGKTMDGIITNRVSLDKAMLVQSVNGPEATLIAGAWDPISAMHGPGAVRCAWLTNQAVLSGFTVLGGATRAVAYPVTQSMSGGGIWAASTSATVDHCVVVSNFASFQGGGVYQATLTNCQLTGNHAYGSGGPGSGITSAGAGGGAANCNLRHCVITANVAYQNGGGGTENCNLVNCSVTKNRTFLNGGGAEGGSLVNCTVSGNISSSYSSSGGAAVSGAVLTNCVVWGNFQRSSYAYTNCANCTLAYCCTDPLALGPGNIALDPQLLMDGVHLAETSPCRGTGTNNSVVGTDIDGQPWNSPPAMGCDEWQPVPVLALQPSWQVNLSKVRLNFTVLAAGQSPFSYYWSKNGAPLQDDGHYSNSASPGLTIDRFNPEDTGAYQVVVSNAFGVVTGQVALVGIHAVDAAGAHPISPYASWATAATTIQDAINASAVGDIVLVTNGIYATGGKVMAGDLTNRVALDKPMTVMSMNGPLATVIQGAWDSVSTNGPGAVRCAWLTNGAVLHGFTLRNGATRASGGDALQAGGGAWCVSPQSVVSSCIISNNIAGVSGGGIAYGRLNNSFVYNNQAGFCGGGICVGVLNNCTVLNNYVPVIGFGAGTYGCAMTNSIVLDNYVVSSSSFTEANNYNDARPLEAAYSCTYPAVTGVGNLDGRVTRPIFLDSYHMAFSSPCRGAGSALYTSGVDLDGEEWTNPPSMGCDEVLPADLVGPLAVNVLAELPNLLPNRPGFFDATVAGRPAWVQWSFGDGVTVTNTGLSVMHMWPNPGDYVLTFTAFNTDNPTGVSTNLLVHVTNPRPPQLQTPMLTSNGFTFQFAGEWLANYTVQYATNLVEPVFWQPLQSMNYSAGQVYQITDPAVTNGTRFYRVLAQ
jgi:hypothetical protein